MLDVQAAKDTFHVGLRDRIAALNPGRTVVVRGVVRPGVVVTENELPGAGVDGIALSDVFCLRWTELRVDAEGASPMLALRCEVRYATDGTASGGGMDRGRALAAMDAELATAVNGVPQHAAEVRLKEAAAGGVTSTATGATVFWGDVEFGEAVMRGERVERVAAVEVFAYGS